MSQILNAAIVVIGIDVGKNSFHVVGLDQRGAIVPRQTEEAAQYWESHVLKTYCIWLVYELLRGAITNNNWIGVTQVSYALPGVHSALHSQEPVDRGSLV